MKAAPGRRHPIPVTFDDIPRLDHYWWRRPCGGHPRALPARPTALLREPLFNDRAVHVLVMMCSLEVAVGGGGNHLPPMDVHQLLITDHLDLWLPCVVVAGP